MSEESVLNPNNTNAGNLIVRTDPAFWVSRKTPRNTPPTFSLSESLETHYQALSLISQILESVISIVAGAPYLTGPKEKPPAS